MGVTMRDVARRAGVSVATVSYVLNGTANVTAETRRSVLEVIEELDYHPNSFARGLAKRATRTLGIAINRDRYLSDPFLMEFVAGIGDTTVAAGYSLLLTPFHNKADLALVKERRVDGLLLLDTDVDDPRLPQLRQQNFPVVIFGRAENVRDFPWIDVDGYAGGGLVVEHLIRLGHRRVAHVAAPQHFMYGRERLRGWYDGLVRAGITPPAAWVVEGDLTEAAGETAVERLLALPEPPTAIFAASDLMAAGVVKAARRRGLRVPEDLAVVGFDDTTMAEWLSPPLTTVQQPILDLGRQAAQMLLEVVEGRSSAPKGVLVLPRLVVRRSCGAGEPGEPGETGEPGQSGVA